MPEKRLRNVHPGLVLKEDFLNALGISQQKFSKQIGLNHDYVSKICQGKMSINAALAIRFSLYFDTSPELWTGLQADYDLEVARQRFALEYSKIKKHSEQE